MHAGKPEAVGRARCLFTDGCQDTVLYERPGHQETNPGERLIPCDSGGFFLDRSADVCWINPA